MRRRLCSRCGVAEILRPPLGFIMIRNATVQVKQQRRNGTKWRHWFAFAEPGNLLVTISKGHSGVCVITPSSIDREETFSQIYLPFASNLAQIASEAAGRALESEQNRVGGPERPMAVSKPKRR